MCEKLRINVVMQKKFKQPVISNEPKISDLEGSFEENSKTFQKSHKIKTLLFRGPKLLE